MYVWPDKGPWQDLKLLHCLMEKLLLLWMLTWIHRFGQKRPTSVELEKSEVRSFVLSDWDQLLTQSQLPREPLSQGFIHKVTQRTFKESHQLLDQLKKKTFKDHLWLSFGLYLCLDIIAASNNHIFEGIFCPFLFTLVWWWFSFHVLSG